jgi:hypothetical protein
VLIIILQAQVIVNYALAFELERVHIKKLNFCANLVKVGVAIYKKTLNLQ